MRVYHVRYSVPQIVAISAESAKEAEARMLPLIREKKGLLLSIEPLDQSPPPPSPENKETP